MTDAVTPIAVDRIGQVILAQIDNRPERAFAERPEDRIAAILTAADDRLREDVLNGLRDSEPELAQRVEQAIFTFDLIPTRIAANDIPKAMKTADVGDLTLAMAYAQSTGQTQITEFILDNLPKRLRANIEELQAIDTVPPKQGSAAQTHVVGSIQNQISSGDISLIQPDPD
jgi:flagellar motor switch protein FliG